MIPHWPERDPLEWSGVSRSHLGRLPRARVHRHTHRTPTGVDVECRSQLLVSLGIVRNEYRVGGWLAARAIRAASTDTDHQRPPDWAWIDARSLPSPF